MKETFSIAMSDSDRTNAVLTGRASLPDCILEPVKASIEEIFERQAAEAVFDISEMSLASYLIGLGRGEMRLTAIPVFLSRAFRHNAIYVRSDSGITHPSELRGRRFGFPEYQMTAAVWVRALFRHEWGIPTEDMSWMTYRAERIPVETPAARSEKDDIFAALVEGEVDAIMTARRPPSQYFPNTGNGGAVRRLIPDVWNVERDYYARTGIFPIMHLVSLKKSTVERHPGLPGQMYELMLKAKADSAAQLLETIKLQASVPWLWESVEMSMDKMNGDIWPYGMKANWPQIETFMSYLVEDGLLKEKLAPEQVFDPSVLGT
ncbi:4,5-dihydroxyphthalate decarboxylase [Paenibacillus humicola]|uniref:4,5-dihydroxyphthalate decarboxylase n=1 Tax=Paenibacillus humicola TaxID=3110540 RepID=UPI00237A7338|nr:4,5-dihydroxyphthalate decarboxylase [Paenibacillus humicola]